MIILYYVFRQQNNYIYWEDNDEDRVWDFY